MSTSVVDRTRWKCGSPLCAKVAWRPENLRSEAFQREQRVYDGHAPHEHTGTEYEEHKNFAHAITSVRQPIKLIGIGTGVKVWHRVASEKRSGLTPNDNAKRCMCVLTAPSIREEHGVPHPQKQAEERLACKVTLPSLRPMHQAQHNPMPIDELCEWFVDVIGETWEDYQYCAMATSCGMKDGIASYVIAYSNAEIPDKSYAAEVHGEVATSFAAEMSEVFRLFKLLFHRTRSDNCRRRNARRRLSSLLTALVRKKCLMMSCIPRIDGISLCEHADSGIRARRR